MATTITLCDEDFINIELNSSPKYKEFEFHMNSTYTKNQTTSSAEELFRNGKLLPLHHHPSSSFSSSDDIFEIAINSFENHKLPFTAPCTNTNTPLDSCNISPSESCRVSCELNPDEYFFNWSTELTQLTRFINNHPAKKSSKKQKLMQKLKSSRTFLKSLFTKSSCTDESLPNKYLKISNRKAFPCPTIASVMKNTSDNHEDSRKSFSRGIKRHSHPTTSNSSSDGSSYSNSSSFNSNSLNELQFLKSSNLAEVEGSIEAAIAHCKKSKENYDYVLSFN